MRNHGRRIIPLVATVAEGSERTGTGGLEVAFASFCLYRRSMLSSASYAAASIAFVIRPFVMPASLLASYR